MQEHERTERRKNDHEGDENFVMSTHYSRVRISTQRAREISACENNNDDVVSGHYLRER